MASIAVSRVEKGVGNIILLTTILVGALLFLLHQLRRSRGPLVIRLLPLLGFLGLLGILAATLRVAEVDGNLTPTLVPWWRPNPDELLETPRVTEARGDVDLATTTPDDFPQFLGPHRDLALDRISFDGDWRQQPPRLVWRTDQFGAGWSGFAAVNGYAVTMEQRGENELVTCYEVATGDLVWLHSEPVRHQTVLGGVGPRATPTIDSGLVYALGAAGLLCCLDGADGKEIWRCDLLEEIGITKEEDAANIAWGRAASPLLDQGRVILPLGTSTDHQEGASLAAWDAETGALLWKHGRRQASYASPMIATLAGVRQIVMVCEDAVSGHDADSGELLWEYDWPGESNSKASCTQPIDAGDDRLFFSKGYAVGSALVRIRRNDGGDWSVAEIWRDWNTMKTKFSNSLLYEGHVYGLDNSILACIELETGKLKWKAGRYGHAQLLRVGDKLIVLEEKRGKVFLVALDPERQLELAAFQALDAKTWSSPCLFGRYLLVRNSEQAACYELPP